MVRNVLLFVSLYVLAVFPAGTLFAVNEPPEDLPAVAKLFLSIFGAFVPVIFGVALVLFLWGITQYLMHSDNEQMRTQGKNFMIWGIICLFVMVSVWGLVSILTSTFGVGNVIPFFQAPG